MRPLPVPDELVAACNAEENAPDVQWQKITMRAPQDWSDAELGKCNDVEVLVAHLRGVPVRYVSRIQVSTDELESIRRTGFFWLSLTGTGMQPFAVWAEDLPDEASDDKDGAGA